MGWSLRISPFASATVPSMSAAMAVDMSLGPLWDRGLAEPSRVPELQLSRIQVSEVAASRVQLPVASSVSSAVSVEVTDP